MEALSCGPTLPSPKESGGRAGPLGGGQSGGRGLPRRPMSHNTGSAHTLSVSPCLPQPTLCSSHPPFSTGTAILVPPCVDQTQPPTNCMLPLATNLQHQPVRPPTVVAFSGPARGGGAPPREQVCQGWPQEKSCSVGRSWEDHGLLRGDVAFPLDCVGSQSCLFGRWPGWGPGLSGLAGCSDADPREPATDPQHQALGPDADRQGQREEHPHHSHGHRGPGREGFPDLGEPATRVHLGPLIPPAMWGFLGTQISRTVGRGAGRGLRCCLGHQKHYGTCQSQPSGIEIMVLVLLPQRSRWGLAEGL